MTIEGYGTTQIANRFAAEKIESPSYHLAKLGYGQHLNKDFSDPYRWYGSSTDDILSRVEYLGHTVNFKSVSKSFKSKKRYATGSDEQMVFENTHPAIVDTETWELANRFRKAAKRCVSRVDGEMHPLTGLMFCAQCGAKMYHERSNPTAKGQKNDYTCANYRRHSTEKCTPHRITQKSVMQIILETLRPIAKYAVKNEDSFRQKVTEMFSAKLDGEVKSQKKRLAACERRVGELDKLIKKLFEQHALGAMSDKRFDLLSAGYETEQETLEGEILELRLGIESYVDSAERAEKKVQYTEQKVEIFFNFIGDFVLPPEEIKLCAEDIARKEHAEQVQRRREYYRDYYRKRKENGGKPVTPARTPEQIETDELASREKLRAYQREYQRKWRQRKRAATDESISA